MKSASSYIHELDWLRAFAVLSVFIYHCGIVIQPGSNSIDLLPGGYLGVDIFFVISGYVITRSLLNYESSLPQSLGIFFLRRIRRLMPAFLFVTLATAIACYFIFSITKLHQANQSLFSSLLFFNNFYFLSANTDYFSQQSEFSPFLHIWSLSIEEQFYLVFPFLFFLIRFNEKLLITVLISLSLISILYMSFEHDKAAFFSVFSRCWELFLGVILAVTTKSSRSSKHVVFDFLSILSICGLLVFLIYDFGGKQHPSIITLIPCLLTCILIYSMPKGTYSKGFHFKPMIWVGKRSYTIYLVHWPLLSILRNLYGIELSYELIIFSIVNTFILSALIYSYIELPFRNKSIKSYKSWLKPILFVWLVSLLLSYSIGYKNAFNTTWVRDNPAIQYEYDADKMFRSGSCFLKTPVQKEAGFINCPEKITAGSMVIWGDSHAAALFSGLKEVLPQTLTQRTAAACSPVLHFNGRENECTQVNNSVMSELLSAGSGTLIIAGRWQVRPWKYLEPIITKLKQQGQWKIIIVGQVPEWSPRVQSVYLRSYYSSIFSLSSMSQYAHDPSYEEVSKINANLKTWLDKFDVIFFDPTKALCNKDGCLMYLNEDDFTTFDYGHLTITGAKVVASDLYKHLD